jgi:hypothetical protein
MHRGFQRKNTATMIQQTLGEESSFINENEMRDNSQTHLQLQKLV